MFLKLQLNTFKLIILSGLLLIGGQSFAQNNQDTQTINDTEMPAAKKPAAPTEQEIEEHDTKDLEQLLKRYNTDSEKVLNDTNKLHNEDAGTIVKESEFEEMRPSNDAAREFSISNVLKTNAIEEKERKKMEALASKSDYSGAVRQLIEPLQKISEKDLLKKMDEQTVDSPLRPYIDQFPESIVFAVRLIKDKEALPSIAKIAEDRHRLIWFVGVMVASLILGIFLKRLMHREGRSFIRAAFYFLIRMQIMFAIRVYIIYYFYSTELTPAAKVFKQTFM